MAEEIEKLWKNLRLTEEEEDEIRVDDDQEQQKPEEVKHWLIGKLLTNRPYNKEALISTLKIIWKLAKAVTILILEENVLLFKFHSEVDKGRVLEGAPWSFDKHLLVLKDYMADLRPDEYCFDRSPFWIRIYDLPIGMRNSDMAGKIGWKIGKLLAKDVSMDSGGWASFLRVRVEIDTTKPLRRSVKIAAGADRDGIRARLSYERLPSFCYGCGLLGHNDVDCPREKDGEENANQYGSWLRASPSKRRSSASKILKESLPPVATKPEPRQSQTSSDRDQGESNKGKNVNRKLGEAFSATTVDNHDERRNDEVGVIQGADFSIAELTQRETEIRIGNLQSGNNGYSNKVTLHDEDQYALDSAQKRGTDLKHAMPVKVRAEGSIAEVELWHDTAFHCQHITTPIEVESKKDDAPHNNQHNMTDEPTAKKGKWKKMARSSTTRDDCMTLELGKRSSGAHAQGDDFMEIEQVVKKTKFQRRCDDSTDFQTAEADIQPRRSP